MEEEMIIEVASATGCKAFIPFTALPADYAGKSVRIVICDEQLEPADNTLELPFDMSI